MRVRGEGEGGAFWSSPSFAAYVSEARWGLSRKLCMISIISSYCWTAVLCSYRYLNTSCYIVLHCVT